MERRCGMRFGCRYAPPGLSGVGRDAGRGGGGRGWMQLWNGYFSNRMGKVFKTLRVGLKRHPCRTKPKMVIHDHFTLVLKPFCKKNVHSIQASNSLPPLSPSCIPPHTGQTGRRIPTAKPHTTPPAKGINVLWRDSLPLIIKVKTDKVALYPHPLLPADVLAPPRNKKASGPPNAFAVSSLCNNYNN